MDVKELYKLTKEYFGYKSRMLYFNDEKKEVACILYDAFVLKCNLDDRYGTFGAGIVLVNQEVMLTDFLGGRCSLNSDEKSIKESLRVVDNYCRLRLPDKFLEEYKNVYEYTRW